MNKEVRDIRIFFFVFSCLLTFLGYKYFPSIQSVLFLSIAPLFIVTSIFSPLTCKPVFRAWLKISSIIGKFNTSILLGLVFFLIVTPIGLAMRLSKKRDPMQRKRSRTRESYWEAYRLVGVEDVDRYKRQF